MFKKLKPLVLLAILAAMAVAVIWIFRLDTQRKQGSFLRELVNIDQSKATKFVVTPAGKPEDAITLELSDGKWFASLHGKRYLANREMMERIFQISSPMVPEQLVSRTRDMFVQHQVDDVTGTRVKVFYGKRLAADFVVGGYQFLQQMVQGQQRPSVFTYVRLAGQDDVYTVRGFLSSFFPAQLNQYRDQTVLNTNRGDIEKISFQGPESFNYELIREGSYWLVNNKQADSAAMAFYLGEIANLSSSAFVDYEAEGWLNLASHQMTIQRKSGLPVEILAYPADTTHQFFITSSQNPGSVFSGSEQDLFENIFFPDAFFMGMPQ